MPLAYLMKSEEAGVRKSMLLHAGVRASVFMVLNLLFEWGCSIFLADVFVL